jgi:hypothetical protein
VGLYLIAALGWLLLSGTAAVARRVRVGTLLLLMAALSWPLMALADGRPFVQAELIGLAPDPTAVAGLGLLLHVQPRSRAGRGLWWVLLVLGVLVCLISAATLATMEQGLAFAPLAAAAIALGAAIRRGMRGH